MAYANHEIERVPAREWIKKVEDVSVVEKSVQQYFKITGFKKAMEL